MPKNLEKNVMDYGLSLVMAEDSYIIKGMDIVSGEYQIIYTGNLSEIRAFMHGMNYLSQKVEGLIENLRRFQNKIDWHEGMIL